MAKKTVATLKSGSGKEFAKVITAVKSPKTGAYTFKEIIAHKEHIKDAFEVAKEQVEAQAEEGEEPGQ